jgi:hypothetical protein
LGKASQTALSITSVTGVSGMALTLVTAGGSGTGAVTYVATNGTATDCTISGSTLTETGVGTCILTATKAADTDFTAISSSPTTVTFASATQAALKVTSVSGLWGTPLSLTTSGGSGTGAVTFVVKDRTATGCKVSASAPYALTVTSPGTCLVTATKAADVSFKATSSPSTTVTLAAPATANALCAQLFMLTALPGVGSSFALLATRDGCLAVKA